MYYWEVQNTGTERWWGSIAHLRSAANLQVPPEELPFHGSLRIRTGQARWFFARIKHAWLLVRGRQAWHIFNMFPGSPARFASCIPSATGLLPTIDPGSFWRRFFYCLLFCLFRVVIIIIFLLENTDFFYFFFNFYFLFFCLNALWSKGAVLLAYEVWDMCCSWHCVWTASVWQGKTTYIKYM